MEHTKICIHMVFWALFFYSCQLSEEVTICDILLWLSLSKTASMISTTCIHTLCSLLLPYTVLGPWDQRYKAEVRVYHFPEYIIKACTFCLGFLSLSDHSLMGKQAAVAMKTFGLPMRRHIGKELRPASSHMNELGSGVFSPSQALIRQPSFPTALLQLESMSQNHPAKLLPISCPAETER